MSLRMTIGDIEFLALKWEFSCDGHLGKIYFLVKRGTFEIGESNGAYSREFLDPGETNLTPSFWGAERYDLVYVATPCMEDFGEGMEYSSLNDSLFKAASYAYSCLESRIIQKRRKNISLKTRFIVMQRDMFTCQLCFNKGKLEIDHRIPFSKGGTDDISNLWTLCFECNRGKSDLPL